MTAKLERQRGSWRGEGRDGGPARRRARGAGGEDDAQMANVLERMNRDRLLKLCGSILSAWRRLATRPRWSPPGTERAADGAAARGKDSLTGRRRRTREAEGHRADMVARRHGSRAGAHLAAGAALQRMSLTRATRFVRPSWAERRARRRCARRSCRSPSSRSSTERLEGKRSGKGAQRDASGPLR